jgi:hypothetical protein
MQGRSLWNGSCRLIDKVGLASSPSKRKIGLFELSREQLQGHQSRAFYGLVHAVDDGLWSMLLAPNGRRQ